MVELARENKPCDAFSRAQHLPAAKRGKEIGPNEQTELEGVSKRALAHSTSSHVSPMRSWPKL